MGPTRKSRSVNNRYSYINEVSPSKDGYSAKKSNSRKRKLSDMLGPRWTMEELTRFYDSYRKYSKEWKKVAGAVRNRSAEMVEALYTMNRAYLSLPHGTASAAGLIAMMTDHYSNLAGSDSDQENNDGAGSSRKTQKRARGKVQPPTPKASDEHITSQSPIAASNYGCLSLLKTNRSGVSRPRPVGKRTPRFPVSFSRENINGEKFLSPTRHGLKLKANADDNEVAHEIAIALAEASQRGGSPQVSGTPNKRAESVMSSPFRHAQRKHNIAEISNVKLLATDTDEEDLEGSTEAGTGGLSRYKPHLIESVSTGATRQKGKKLEGRKYDVDNNIESHLDDIKEECSGTEEGQQLLSAMRKKFDVEVNDTKVSRSPMLKKKGKKVLFGRDEEPAFDALQTLADLSLMMPADTDDDSRMLFKDEHDYVDETVPLESPPANQPREKRRSLGVRMKGHLASSVEVASSKTSKPGNSSVFYGSSVLEENQDSHQSTSKSRKKQKIPVPKNKKTEAHAEIHLSGSPGIEAGDVSKKSIKSKKYYSQSSSPKVMKVSENSSGADLQKEGTDSAHSATQVPVNQVNLPTKMRSRRKLSLKKPLVKKDLKFSEKISNDESNLSPGSLHDTVPKNLSNCLSNQRLRRWCTYEWFYSGIDYPWFAKREFVEYLYHVGLGHVPRLTRVEWGVIRSSLGKPRRFSEQFLKEEKEKLNQYRNSVRKHYSELREGLRDELSTDLARPLSVGQRVIAIHPKTREIHDGSVLTVDHSKCRIQFDCQELGVEFVMDIDCMPVNSFESMPAMLGRHTITADKFFESFNELKENGRTKEYIKLSPSDNLDNMDDISALSLLANPASLLKQSKVASDVPTRYQQSYSQSGTLAQIQAKEADIQALAQLTRALDKKEAIVLELRLMNDDVLESQKNGDNPLKESEPFKKQYAAVLIQLNEANEQVSSALHCLRERNTYQGKFPLTWPRPLLGFADPGSAFNSFDRSACQTQEVGSHVNEIMDSSRTKARTMVDAALQAISSLKNRDDTMEKIEEAVDYVNDRLPSDDSCIPMRTDPKASNASDIEAQIPSELITKCVATLLMIQKCTERQFPPSDVAQILDSAVTSLQPQSSHNLPVYTEIQKCVGIIKNQILALIPT
ncbi:protein ALWAYS EARLY 3-like isoform X2 [Salvia divinorum]|uniref:Protein ALWAYS EARLY 3-like isoform X2 n=1 Tax=Salvia divinorum TaxID=28513 RepID=A0ABD1GG63_SALDI